ncbi:hypothetical protein C2G38_2096544 [Gigaspora rosea]|uniref:TNFR-Cys domain-containing protein n=1 Tax=Gigaspora rosea TaxID=44941 RepID=A0A397UX54_9GLOM|nr:hypothetical protein C2G38_2096544 [Gigaspora rosea]
MNRYHILFAVIFFVLFLEHVSSQKCTCRYNIDCETVCTFPVWEWCLNDECVKPCSQNSDCPLKICNNATCGCHSNSDCTAAFPFCYPVDGRDYGDCRICKDDNDCVKTGVYGFNICVNGNCKECDAHDQCNDGQVCREGSCQYCQKDSDCPSSLGGHCNADLGMCCTNSNCTCNSNSDCSVWFPNCGNINDTIKRCEGCGDYECPDGFCLHNLCCKQKGCTCKARSDCPEDSYCSVAGFCKKCPTHAPSC